MKRQGYIFEQIIEEENLKLAIMCSSLGKRDQKRVSIVLGDMDTHVKILQKIIGEQIYEPAPYIIKTIQDKSNAKIREIYKPKYFPDQVIHWALMLKIEPLIMRGMYKYSCGSIPNRGTSFGQKTVRKWLDNDRRNTKYCLKIDIEKFYPSIDNEIMKSMFRNLIKDKKCLWLIDKIIDSNRGLPIGNYTSQWFSNYFLQGLDHYIKQQLEIKYYVRYVDDLVLFGPSKKKLHKARIEIANYLLSLKLKVKDNWQVFRVDSRGIDFLGFRFFRDKTILRRRNVLRIKRRIKKISKKERLYHRDASAIISYWGWIKRSDSYNFYNKYVKPYVKISLAKKVVSRYGRYKARIGAAG